jgi:hypothetical protein
MFSAKRSNAVLVQYTNYIYLGPPGVLSIVRLSNSSMFDVACSLPKSRSFVSYIILSLRNIPSMCHDRKRKIENSFMAEPKNLREKKHRLVIAWLSSFLSHILITLNQSGAATMHLTSGVYRRSLRYAKMPRVFQTTPGPWLAGFGHRSCHFLPWAHTYSTSIVQDTSLTPRMTLLFIYEVESDMLG